MHMLVYLPLVVTALAALAARPLSDRLPPATATWLLAGSAVVLAATTGAVLGLLALTALIRVPLIATGHWSVQVVSQHDPASLPVAIIAGCALAVAATAAVRTFWRRGRAIAVAHRHARELPGRGKVVIAEDESPDAYTLPGMPCRIVVTTGMLRALSGPEQRVLLAHERTHAAWYHYLFTTAARLAAAANPLLRPVATEVGYTVERWADERAAALTGDRTVAARAIARAALATKAAPAREPEAALVGLGINGANGAGVLKRGTRPGPVPRRVAALLRPAPRHSALLVIGAVLLVMVAGASALEAARDLHALMEMASGGS
jgi:Zn-dependent protease with chaperone function